MSAPASGQLPVPPVSVTGAAVHLPGLSAADIPGGPAEPAVAPAEAYRVLGRKGLLAKEPATRLAMCAAQTALGLGIGKVAGPVAGAEGTGVVVASNLGNVATVCNLVDTVRTEGKDGVSIMEGPNASSNVVASSIALRFGFTGPNFLVSSGATAGLDAVRLGSLLVRAGRTHRCVVVGAEPDDDIATALRPGIRAAAAAVVLEPDADGPRLGTLTRSADAPTTGTVTGHAGETYGAEGVVELATAVSGDAVPGSVSCGDHQDGYATLTVESR
ncbi:hypothetical protein GCM10009676_09620 [Prauserella halophila]|uniref:Beta-ketoacyl synthase-like N-terminal domain-containing protein n=1 Tax=Prauserella halophila TaxID=185641 RepID=A0ABP4GLP7_9PSEU|nr:beta-ketoacyl synthase N-terminal-like domain-containing protein [Prauserella halophila]MCP2235318.1 Beta-ketoacyl synthase, N-terminal domain [Prauserella halophila]